MLPRDRSPSSRPRRHAATVAFACVLSGLSLGADARWSPEQVVLAGPATLPSERCGDLFFVEVTVGDARALSMLLDTGSQVTVIDDGVAPIVGGVRRDDAMAVSDSGGGGSVIREWIRVESLRVGALELRRLDVAVLDLDGLAVALGRTIDGVLGFTAFRSVLLTLDYPAGVARVDVGRLASTDVGEVFAYRDSSRPHVPLRLDGRTFPALVDSGATPAIAMDALGMLEFTTAPAQVGRSTGVSGRTAVRAARMIGDGRVGRHGLRTPVVRSSRRGARVGGAFLRHFVVTFDATSRRVRLQRDGDDPVPFDAVRGLGVGLDDAADCWIVADLYGAPDGPLRIGDEIVSVGGRAVSGFGCERLTFLDHLPSVALIVRRGGVEQELDVPVRVLVR